MKTTNIWSGTNGSLSGKFYGFAGYETNLVKNRKGKKQENSSEFRSLLEAEFQGEVIKPVKSMPSGKKTGDSRRLESAINLLHEYWA